MRITVFKAGGNAGTGGFVSNGLTLQGPLILSGPHSEPLHAVPKQYIDNIAYNLNANNVTSGTLAAARLPAFIGDATTILGSSNIILSNTGVTPGSIVKPTVDAKGRVVSSGALIETDISSVGFNKITANNPITLDGYGITDGVKLSSDITLQGSLILHADPVNVDHAATKQYVDEAAGQAGGISVGDIIRKPYTITPYGFLKCNGAELDKTTYANLYSIIGDTFSIELTPGAGRPWQQQNSFNDLQSTDVLGWTAGTSLPGVLALGQSLVTKNRVYILGGFTGTGAFVTTVYTAPINTDGTLGAWTTGTAIPVGLLDASVFVVKNKAYIVGGRTGTGVGTYVSTVYVANINSDGTIGAWTTSQALPSVLGYCKTIVTKNRVYTLGGYNGSTYVTSMYSAVINIDGTLGPWTVQGTTPYSASACYVAVIKNRVYLIGGYIGTYKRDVYYATIDGDGVIGTWTSGIFLPKGMGLGECFVTKNRVYITFADELYSANIASDGSLSVWSKNATLSANMTEAECIITSSKVYLISSSPGGGFYYGNVISANFAGGLDDYSAYYGDSGSNYVIPGAGQPWRQQYGINTTQSADITGWINDVDLPTALSASEAIVTKNRVYLCGGTANGTTYLSTVYTAPINADGTLGTWTTGTALPGILGISQAVLTKNRVYLLGGSTNGSNAVSTVYTAPINADGTLGAWTTGTALPSAVARAQALVTKNRVYLLGGSNGTSGTSIAYTAPINTDGTLGAWSGSTSLPIGVSSTNVAVTKNRVYIIGGDNTTPATIRNSYTAPINSDGTLGAWVAGPLLPSGRAWSQIFTTNNTVYLFGGRIFNGANYNTVYKASINPDGTLGAWLGGTSLLAAGSASQVFITKNKIYLQNGINVYSANISSVIQDYSPYYDGTINFDDATINYIMPGSGKPWQQQYQINTTQSTDITGWVTESSVLPVTLSASSVVVTKNRVYLLGGAIAVGTYTSVCYTASINIDGTLGTWTTDVALPGTLGGSQAIVTKNRVYLLGGNTGSSYVNTVYTAPINSDGTLGAWVTGTSLPTVFGMAQAFITKDRVYVCGGYNGTSHTSIVYTAPINSDGTLGTWVSSTSLPGNLSWSQAIVTKNRVYLLGGSAVTGAAISTVYTAVINTDGTLGTWSTGTALPAVRGWAQAIVVKDRVYLLGGSNGTTSQSTVYTAPINTDGTLGTWTTGTALPGLRSHSQAIVTKNYVYLLAGGTAAGGFTDIIYSAAISSDIQDYSPYYDGTIQPVSTISTKFSLPDYSVLDKEFGEYVTSYIKF